MSIYNLINGVNQATFLFLPMLGKHPDEYPRFRDCFLRDMDHREYDDMIHVYTRVGGANRGQGYGEEELMKHPDFVATFDDISDSTYATYVFKVPDRWKEDFEKLRLCNADISPEYLAEMKRVYPKIGDRFDTFMEQMREAGPLTEEEYNEMQTED